MDIDQFIINNSPKLVLRTPLGVNHTVLGLDRAAQAIRNADIMQSMSGAFRLQYATRFEIDNPRKLMKDLKFCSPFMVYYESSEGLPTKAEIKKAMAEMARSTAIITLNDEKPEQRISGTRCVIYPERYNPLNGKVCALVSPFVWFNANRATLIDVRGYGAAILEDVNQRVTTGVFSYPRP